MWNALLRVTLKQKGLITGFDDVLPAEGNTSAPTSLFHCQTLSPAGTQVYGGRGREGNVS